VITETPVGSRGEKSWLKTELETYRGRSKMKIMQTLKRDLEAGIVSHSFIHENKEESHHAIA
jgi:hypothetical protein